MTISNDQSSRRRLDFAGPCEEFTEGDQKTIWQGDGFMFPRLAHVDEVNWFPHGELPLQFPNMDLLYQDGPRTLP
jgi:hypothetical protein